MSDFVTREGGDGGESRFDQMTNGPFFKFSKPYLDFIGKEKVFLVVYYVMAGLNLLIPILSIINAVRSGIFKMMPAKFTVAFIFSWFVITFACWIGFQLWWDRRKEVAIVADSEFIATPIFAELLRTFGEWLGTLIGIVGAGVGLITTIILGDAGKELFEMIDMDFLGMGALVIIIGPVIGFFIIVISRFLAEQLKIFAALAHNTKEIAVNIKNGNKGS